MDITKHVNDINGFVEAYEEVYESVRIKKDGTGDTSFILMRAHDVVEAFQEKYNVNLIKTQDDESSVGDMVFSFDTVNFKTPENQTMCLLKCAY